MSDFLFAQPSLLSGAGRCLDLAGLFDTYNISPTPQVADARAIEADFRTVGADIRDAMDSVAAGRG